MAKWICINCKKPCKLIMDEEPEDKPINCPFDGGDVDWELIKDTGCPACDKLPGVNRCLKCQADELDAEIVANMKAREKLEQKIASKGET